MKIIIYITIYTLINIYILNKIIGWFTNINTKLNKKAIKIVTIVLYVICYLSVILGYLLPTSTLQKFIQIFANYFTGCMIYGGIIFLLLDIGKIIAIKIFKVNRETLKSKKYLYTIGITLIILVIVTNIYGNYHAQQIKVNNYDVNINKTVSNTKDLKIALIADFHLGYSIGYKMMEDMAKKINKEDVDVVLIAGDIFDNSVKTVDDMEKCKNALGSIKSKYGKYATFGNHDIDEKLFEGFSVKSDHDGYRDKEMEKILIDAGIKILDDEVFTLLDNSINVIGRKDSERTGFGEQERESIESLIKKVDISKPTIVVEHEPRNLPGISKLGADLHLAGHTHAGQIFPFSIGVNIMWKNSVGKKLFGNMTSIVTPGIGVYGPFLRVGTDSEISIVNVHFN